MEKLITHYALRITLHAFLLIPKRYEKWLPAVLISEHLRETKIMQTLKSFLTLKHGLIGFFGLIGFSLVYFVPDSPFLPADPIFCNLPNQELVDEF